MEENQKFFSFEVLKYLMFYNSSKTNYKDIEKDREDPYLLKIFNNFKKKL